MPADATETSNKPIDVDADGVPDIVRTYSSAPRRWPATGTSGSSSLPARESTSPCPTTRRRARSVVLGGTYIGSDVEPGPEGPRPAIFVKTGAGASTSIISLFRLSGCTLLAMGGGTPFPVGAAATHSESCDARGSPAPCCSFQQAQLSGDGVTYEVIDTGYTRDGDDLAVYGGGPQHHQSADAARCTTTDRLPGLSTDAVSDGQLSFLYLMRWGWSTFSPSSRFL